MRANILYAISATSNCDMQCARFLFWLLRPLRLPLQSYSIHYRRKRIIGVIPACRKQFSFFVYLDFSLDRCGVSLLTKYHQLFTATHCTPHAMNAIALV
ncbi:hypothetical protein L596_030427 [Steinernema carpocapsae]|uniref:Uncharacterized protein n=1 Tax=Steinernema carpocapsae TaxID=34508 RepID=A0A4U5LPC6_STECR|nr:hypothetical protein L596_030427 [Steinernema carpocapsae]